MRRAAALSMAIMAASCSEQRAPQPANDAQPSATNAPQSEPATTNETAAIPPFAEMPGAHPTAPEPAPIPARFRGTWAKGKAACADIKDHSRLTISGRTLRFPTFVIFGDTVTTSGNQFAVKGKIEGTDRPAEAQYFINEAGTELTDGGGGGAVRVRCG